MGSLRVAVVGATGLVGRTILRVLEERSFPVGELSLLASKRSAGTTVSFAGTDVTVRELTPEGVTDSDVTFFSAGADISRAYAPLAADTGALVVDNSSAFRADPEIPLVVPEVNGDLLTDPPYRGIVANPNCSTIQLVVALEPLHRCFDLIEVIVATYQSVSGSGGKGVRTLERELAGSIDGGSPYPHPISGNVLPHIDTFGADGWSGEERKMMNETRKIMRLPALHIIATTVRVPVAIGHSEAVYARFTNDIGLSGVRTALGMAPGVIVADDPERNIYPMALDAAGRDEVFVGRLRRDPDDPHGLVFWIVADNVRKGAATNAVQCAELALSIENVHA